jgi:hypothetical protein
MSIIVTIALTDNHISAICYQATAQIVELFSSQYTADELSNSLISANTIFAQLVKNRDILLDLQSAWTNFIKSGQAWALLIGLFLGYMFKSFTSS